MYYVVEFRKDKEISVVPELWLKDDKRYCFWPPYKCGSKITAAIKTCQEPNESWPFFKIRCLSNQIEAYDVAISKCKKAEETSDLTSEDCENENDRPKRRRILRPTHLWSEDSDCDNLEQPKSKVVKKTVRSYCIPPAPAFPAKTLLSSRSKAVSQDVDETVSEGEVIDDPLVPVTPSMASTPVRRIITLPRTSRSPLSCIQPISLENKENSRSIQVSAVEKQIIKKLLSIASQVELNTHLLQQVIAGKGGIESEADDAEEVLAQFPLKTEEELQILENDLTKEQMKKLLVESVGRIGGKSIDNTTRRVLSKLLDDDIAIKYSWAGLRGKKAFKQLKMKDLVYAAVRQNPKTKTATDEAIEGVIKTWLKGAKDRNGGRANRDPRRVRPLDHS